MRPQDPGSQGALVTHVAGAPWRPLLRGRLRDEALRTADSLVGGLRLGAQAHGSASLSTGAAGLAVCYAMVARSRDDAGAALLARAHIDQAIEVLATEPLPASLYAGFTGIAWAAELVDQLLGEQGEDRNEAIDHALATLLERYPPDDAPYDLVHGLTGLGVYGLARWPRPAAAGLLAGVVDQLARRARWDEDGAFWWTPPSLLLGPRRELHPRGGVDLGVAHGISGVIPFLARVQALGVDTVHARPLLEGAVHWLCARVVEAPWGRTVPAFVAEETEAAPARSAWCYGDPGVATALLLAARDAGESGWADLGMALAVGAAARPPEQTGVGDAGLCHGAAGLAHLFNRMHQLTGVPELAEAAVFWIGRTMDMCSASFTEARGSSDDASPAWNGNGLLEGVAGIALALLAAGTASEPIWDPMFLVSTGDVPTRQLPTDDATAAPTSSAGVTGGPS
jgi:lantibiotic biosynthesis protein